MLFEGVFEVKEAGPLWACGFLIVFPRSVWNGRRLDASKMCLVSLTTWFAPTLEAPLAGTISVYHIDSYWSLARHNGNGCYIFSTWDWLPRFMWFFPCYMRSLVLSQGIQTRIREELRPASEQRKDMLAALVKEFEAGNSCRVSRWLTTGVVVVVTIYFLVGWTSPMGACHQISRAWASTIQYPHLSLRMVVSSPANKWCLWKKYVPPQIGFVLTWVRLNMGYIVFWVVINPRKRVQFAPWNLWAIATIGTHSS